MFFHTTQASRIASSAVLYDFSYKSSRSCRFHGHFVCYFIQIQCKVHSTACLSSNNFSYMLMANERCMNNCTNCCHLGGVGATAFRGEK